MDTCNPGVRYELTKFRCVNRGHTKDSTTVNGQEVGVLIVKLLREHTAVEMKENKVLEIKTQ